MQHELFHAAQDQQLGGILQDQNERVRSFASRIIRDVTIEVAAHFWGGPLIGLPFLAVLGYLFYLIADETVQWVRVLSQLGWPA